jgi:2-keto-myo-inositol isomerase
VGKWKLGLNGISLNCGQAEEIAIAGGLGYDYLELRLPKLEEFLRERPIEDLPRLFSEAQVKPLSINGIEPIAVGPGENSQQFAERARRCLTMAGRIGCECVVVNPYGIAKGLSESEGRRRVVEGLKLVSDIAAKCDVKLAYEFLDSQFPVHTIADTMEVLQSVDRNNVGWLLDFHFFHVADGSLESLARAGADRLLLVHVNDLPNLPLEDLALGKAARVFPGDGALATESILKTLHQMGYQGPFSVEVLDPKFLSWDPLEFCSVAKEKMLAVLDRYYR